MRKSIYILSIISMGLFSCASQKKLQAETPFKLGNATCQTWVGGRAESGGGIMLTIPVAQMPADDIVLQDAFFRGKIATIGMDNQNEGVYAVAKFIKKPMITTDIIMHEDPRMEVGNQPPKMPKTSQDDFTFELLDSEAIISYVEKGKLKYAKITGIKEKVPLIRNSKPRN